MDPTPRTTPHDGTLLGGRYRLGRVLGRGGTATVHAATDEVLGRQVAVKVLAPGLGTGAGREDEARLLAALSHPHLVTLHDADLVGDPAYLVMELVPGPSLAEQLREHGPLTVAQVEALARQLGSALEHIHGRGLVHRDLKPANVLLAAPLTPGGSAPPDARLTDFGIARLTDAARLTATGTVLGTAAYLSPEQARGGAVGPPSDVWSLGLVLLEAISGETAYPGPPLEAAAARLSRPPEVPADLPQPLGGLLAAMTAADPAHRPTAAEVARLDAAPATQRLAAAPEQGTAPLPTSTRVLPADATTVLPDGSTRVLGDGAEAADAAGPGRRRRTGLLLGLVAVVVALVLGVVLLTRPGSTATPATRPTTTAPAAPTTTAPTTAATSSAPSSPTVVATSPAVTSPAGPVGNGGKGNGGGNGKGGPAGKDKKKP